MSEDKSGKHRWTDPIVLVPIITAIIAAIPTYVLLIRPAIEDTQAPTPEPTPTPMSDSTPTSTSPETTNTSSSLEQLGQSLSGIMGSTTPTPTPEPTPADTTGPGGMETSPSADTTGPGGMEVSPPDDVTETTPTPSTPPKPELPDDGRPLPQEGANQDAKTWVAVQMKDDPTMWKVTDDKGINVADQFHSVENTQKYIDYYVWEQSQASTPEPTPTPTAGLDDFKITLE